jgi:hypothetical protein
MKGGSLYFLTKSRKRLLNALVDANAIKMDRFLGLLSATAIAAAIKDAYLVASFRFISFKLPRRSKNRKIPMQLMSIKVIRASFFQNTFYQQNSRSP